jgi:hypothetical protein
MSLETCSPLTSSVDFFVLHLRLLHIAHVFRSKTYFRCRVKSMATRLCGVQSSVPQIEQINSISACCVRSIVWK